MYSNRKTESCELPLSGATTCCGPNQFLHAQLGGSLALCKHLLQKFINKRPSKAYYTELLGSLIIANLIIRTSSHSENSPKWLIINIKITDLKNIEITRPKWKSIWEPRKGKELDREIAFALRVQADLGKLELHFWWPCLVRNVENRAQNLYSERNKVEEPQ